MNDDDRSNLEGHSADDDDDDDPAGLPRDLTLWGLFHGLAGDYRFAEIVGAIEALLGLFVSGLLSIIVVLYVGGMIIANSWINHYPKLGIGKLIVLSALWVPVAIFQLKYIERCGPLSVAPPGLLECSPWTFSASANSKSPTACSSGRASTPPMS